MKDNPEISRLFGGLKLIIGIPSLSPKEATGKTNEDCLRQLIKKIWAEIERKCPNCIDQPEKFQVFTATDAKSLLTGQILLDETCITTTSKDGGGTKPTSTLNVKKSERAGYDLRLLKSLIHDATEILFVVKPIQDLMLLTMYLTGFGANAIGVIFDTDDLELSFIYV